MAKQTPRGLGRGLDALLGGSHPIDMDKLRQPVGYVNKTVAGEEAPESTSDIMMIPIDKIETNPYQPRVTFNEEALEELSESIRTLGLIQPITVRKGGSSYQIISGERRFRACKKAGMEMIPAYIRTADDQGMLEMAIVENIQRENLDPIEVAMSYQRLMDECNLTQENMAERVGKKRASVANYLRLLKLPAKIQHDLKVGLVSVGHAKVLLGIEDSKIQEQLCDLVIKKELSVRQLEDKIKLLSNENTSGEDIEIPDLPESYYKVLEHMGRWFGDNISLKRNASGKGSMTVRFNSDEEMNKFLEALQRTEN